MDKSGPWRSYSWWLVTVGYKKDTVAFSFGQSQVSHYLTSKHTEWQPHFLSCSSQLKMYVKLSLASSPLLPDRRVLNQLRICHRECFPTRLGWGIRKLIFSFELSTTDRNSFNITLACKGRHSQSGDRTCERLPCLYLGEKICVLHFCYKR